MTQALYALLSPLIYGGVFFILFLMVMWAITSAFYALLRFLRGD
ncbi:MAG: hypothetical protein AAF125_22265 [Chloroflexota bacterium]